MLAMSRNLAVSLQRQFKRSVLMLTTQSVPYIEVVKNYFCHRRKQIRILQTHFITAYTVVWHSPN